MFIPLDSRHRVKGEGCGQEKKKRILDRVELVRCAKENGFSFGTV